MIRATLKSLLSRKLRLVLSGLAVVLGVMFVSGAFVLTDTLRPLVRQPVRHRRTPNTDVQVTPAVRSSARSDDGEDAAGDGIAPDVVAKVAAGAGRRDGHRAWSAPTARA